MFLSRQRIYHSRNVSVNVFGSSVELNLLLGKPIRRGSPTDTLRNQTLSMLVATHPNVSRNEFISESAKYSYVQSVDVPVQLDPVPAGCLPASGQVPTNSPLGKGHVRLRRNRFRPGSVPERHGWPRPLLHDRCYPNNRGPASGNLRHRRLGQWRRGKRQDTRYHNQKRRLLRSSVDHGFGRRDLHAVRNTTPTGAPAPERVSNSWHYRVVIYE